METDTPTTYQWKITSSGGSGTKKKSLEIKYIYICSCVTFCTILQINSSVR